MSFVLIKTKEGFDRFAEEMQAEYGLRWPVHPSPATYPCLVLVEYITGNESPDYIERYIIEMWHFEQSEKCAIIDQVYE